MKYTIPLSLALFAISAQAQAAVMHYFDGALPASPTALTGPTPSSVTGGPILFTPPVPSATAGATYVGLSASYSGIARSPFETSPPGTYNAPVGYYGVSTYTSISGGGSACFGTCDIPTFARASAAPSFGTGGNTLSFVYGSPDTYNTLRIFLDDGTVLLYHGGDIGPTPQYGYVTEHFSGLVSYHGVEFSSTSNAFEFSVVSAVPLPASLPMFGAGLLVLAGFSYGLNRWVAPKTRSAAQTA